MNKTLKEKLLFITGGVIAIFGLVFFQQNFPSFIDYSKFLAQVPGENIYEECISDPTKIIQNGNFEQIINILYPFNTYTLTNPKQVCFFEGISNYVFLDEDINSKVLLLYYVRHVFDGNPENYLFNSDQSFGVFQYLGNLEQGEYTISFNAKTVVNTIGDVPTENTLRLYIGFSDTLISPPNPFSYSQECEYYTNNLDSNIVHWTKPGMFEECTLSQLDSYDFIDITSEDYQTYSKTIEISNSGPAYMYFFPVGEDPIWTAIDWSIIKPAGSILIDDISIEPSLFTCAITFQGEQELYYSTLGGEYVLHDNTPLSVDVIGNTPPATSNPNAFYMYSPVPGYLHIKAPTNVEYTDQDILELFSIQGGTIISALLFSGGNFWIEYECLVACSELQQDFNQDGVVDEGDVQLFINFFGQLCENLETCQFDLSGNGIIGVEDMMMLLSSLGQECAPPIQESQSSEISVQNQVPKPIYQSQGKFVKPRMVSRLQKSYNYIVNTDISNRGQTAMRIEKFFPDFMTLRGFYTSTKNASLVSREGIVRFFDLGKITNITSYLYLEASPEICQIVSQNPKAYTELVSYKICK